MLLKLAPGLYQFRVRWVDGTVYESYLPLSCERRISTRHRRSHRVVGQPPPHVKDLTWLYSLSPF